MEFIDSMAEAMAMIQNACQLNTEWKNCEVCPFRDYCDVLEIEELGTPDEWELSQKFEKFQKILYNIIVR